jgi:hypothetical protein
VDLVRRIPNRGWYGCQLVFSDDESLSKSAGGGRAALINLASVDDLLGNWTKATIAKGCESFDSVSLQVNVSLFVLGVYDQVA